MKYTEELKIDKFYFLYFKKGEYEGSTALFRCNDSEFGLIQSDIVEVNGNDEAKEQWSRLMGMSIVYMNFHGTLFELEDTDKPHVLFALAAQI